MVKLGGDFLSEMIWDKLSLADPWYQLVMEMLRSVCNFSGKRIIEVGCGLGGFVANVSRDCGEVIGLDVSSKAVHIAKNVVTQLGIKDKVSFVIGDAQFLPFKAQSGDILVCSETLEHVPDYERAFGELIRVTKNSGYLCLTVPNFLSTAFFENVILLLVGQPSYVKSHVSVEKEHIFHAFKLKKLLSQQDVKRARVGAITGRGINRNTDQSWVTKTENTYLHVMSLLRLGESKIHSTRSCYVVGLYLIYDKKPPPLSCQM